MMKRSEVRSQRSVGYVLFVLFVLSVHSLTAQNVVPVQANTNGLLLSPSPFLRTNITGAGNISILPSLVGHGIIISNTAGDVTLGQLNSVSNILRTNFVAFDAIGSNYLYSLIVGGGAGEVNVNANAGTTNATLFGWVNPKSGDTNFLKTVQPGYGMAGTNQTTNLVLAVDGEVIASQPQLNTASNLLRTMVLTNAIFTSNGLLAVTVANDVTASNLFTARDIATSNGVVTLLLANDITTSNGVVVVLRAGDITTSNGVMTYISTVSNVLDTLARTKQHGSLILSNFIAMGITNIIAGTNTVIYTNAGVLVINAVPGGGGSGVIATNPNQFGASPILTIKDEPWFTNIVSFGSLNGFHALFDGMLTVVQETYLEGGVYIYGARTTGNTILGLDADLFVQSIVISNGLTFTGTNLSADVTTPLLNTASNALRTFTITSATTTSNSLLATLIANDTTTSNALRVASANTAFVSLLSGTNPPVVKTISAGANITLTNNVTNIVVAASGGFGSPITTTNFTNNATSWSPPAGTTRIRIRAWGAGGDGSGPSSGPTYANPGTGGGGGAYGESVFPATSSSSFDLFVGVPTTAVSTYVRAAGSGVDLMRLAGGTNGTSGAEPIVSGGPGGAIILADWGVAGQMGWQRNDGLFGGQGGGSFGTTGGQGGNDWTPGVTAGFGDGVKGMTPGGGGGGGRATYATTGGIGGLGMIVIEIFGSP